MHYLNAKRFTLGWNDWTNNLVGLEDQLLNGYPATPDGQMEFIARMKELILQTNRGTGLCYWGAELIAFDGEQSSNGSSWENQAVFTFSITTPSRIRRKITIQLFVV